MATQGDPFQNVPLTSLSLTHVEFSSEDKIAYAFAYITLLPLAILIFYASVIVSRRELAGIFMLAGQLLNEGLNAVLKEYLKMHRPHGHLGTGYGMPSSHAQFIWFFAVYGSLYLKKAIHLDNSVWKVLVSFGMFGLAILVSVSRIYLGYHTSGQVAVGASIGSIFGILWYCLVEHVIRPSGLVELILRQRFAKLVYLRDLRSVDNVAKLEYQQWESFVAGQKPKAA
ncbi:phosphatidic acid phosphatase type 2/haloperoxidase [Phycomyces blakesleeanus]|uniref:Dolichyldiphosphatase n=2 Tax=Phycomyces blakesleeanus TaxID=4837 RepID=A0A167LKR0_PHYB8|nr:hypothetical protein PHYBLDRAFT_115387 [Phycomyces blakesleeanus NRRL 1555(-)]OAD70658.1 hypothetical protein PHYBLDRAFT_115387 [Phycomyces blakesleeanus NRRL 1555(-)]|eukprot:XP_018288698.1 hypothetical protein PHYBLDRAFT_115387 [Phycomyces blakesleeanus NRRL 1555(-)]